jgi:hypothetical protein
MTVHQPQQQVDLDDGEAYPPAATRGRAASACTYLASLLRGDCVRSDATTANT